MDFNKNKDKKHSEETKMLWSKQRSGDKNSNSKLTKNEVIKIREMYFNESYSQNKLAELFKLLSYPFQFKHKCID